MAKKASSPPPSDLSVRPPPPSAPPKRSLRGFGITFDFKSGSARSWVVDQNGIKRGGLIMTNPWTRGTIVPRGANRGCETGQEMNK